MVSPRRVQPCIVIRHDGHGDYADRAEIQHFPVRAIVSFAIILHNKKANPINELGQLLIWRERVRIEHT